MTTETLSQALEREHHEIDGGIEAFQATLASGAADIAPLVKASAALRRHIYLEEEFVFPRLRAAGLFAALIVMYREHGELWTILDELDAAVAVNPPSQATARLCTTLLQELDAHNSKEEPIIYPQVDAALTGDAAISLREFLAAGEMPAGWVCQDEAKKRAH